MINLWMDGKDFCTCVLFSLPFICTQHLPQNARNITLIEGNLLVPTYKCIDSFQHRDVLHHLINYPREKQQIGDDNVDEGTQEND